MASIPDGRIWCEGCDAWLPTCTAYRRHRGACPGRHRFVERRALHERGETRTEIREDRDR